MVVAFVCFPPLLTNVSSFCCTVGRCSCVQMGARLVSLETEAENAFVIENLLWIGFFGEAYTG